MQNQFSCSTMWNVRSHENGADSLREMISLGFSQVELNYLITKEKLAEMMPVIESGEISVSSVHNVFPRISDVGYSTDDPLLGYLDAEKRANSVKLTKTSIDYAHNLGAGAVVLHVSTIPLEKDYQRDLRRLYLENMRNSEQYKLILDEFLCERARKAPQVLDYTAQSLIELSEYIEKKGYNVKLGVENRSKIDQIPTLEEFEYLFDKVGGAQCGFWYDIGHGILMENYGLLTVFPKIQEIASKIVGMHIHDAGGVEDHFVPYHFGQEFDQYIPIIKNAPIKVFEVGPKCNAAQLKESFLRVVQKTSE